MPPTYCEPTTNGASRSKTLATLAPVFFYFLTAGIATVMLGPLLPLLIRHWQILDAQAGTLFTADFLGQLCGAWFAARNLRASVLYGSALTAAGCVLLTQVSFAAAPIAFLCIGLGLGAGMTAGNILVGITASKSRAPLIALLNVAWSVGAIVCTLLVRLSGQGGARMFLLVTAASLATASLVAITIPRAQHPRVVEVGSNSVQATTSAMPLPPIMMYCFAAAMFLYVGTENSLGGWLPSYALRTNPSLQAASISLYFWIGELVGRLLIGALCLRVSEAILYRACLAVLISTTIVLCSLAHVSPTSVIVIAVLSGLSLAPLYPLIVSFMLSRTGNHPRLGAIFAFTSLGGAILPWLTGILSTEFHGLRAGLIVPASGACLLLLLATVLTGKTPRGISG